MDAAIPATTVHGLVDQDVMATVNRVIVGQQTMRGRLLAIAAKPRDGAGSEHDSRAGA